MKVIIINIKTKETNNMAQYWQSLTNKIHYTSNEIKGVL